MPFSHQLVLPPVEGSAVTVRLERWRRRPSEFVERGDVIADLSLGDAPHVLRIDFPCMLSSLVPQAGAVLTSGERIGACAAEGEDLPYNRESLVIQTA